MLYILISSLAMLHEVDEVLGYEARAMTYDLPGTLEAWS